jgi:hypothetical protein
MRNEGHYSYAEIYPHFVIEGSRHIDPAEKVINQVAFVIDDAGALFYDFDAFGHVLHPEKIIDQIILSEESWIKRKLPKGPRPEIFYFTGREEIFLTDTDIGQISVSNRPSYSSPGSSGFALKNTIFVTISFQQAVVFEDAISRLGKLMRYLGLLVGRPQNLQSVYLHLESDTGRPSILDVYWSNGPKREEKNDRRGPNHWDILIDAIQSPALFSSVLQNWFKRDETWNDARGRFFANLYNQRFYDQSRLIGAANMFDLLPSSSIPQEISLPPELQKAKKVCRDIFIRLPDSIERSSVLNELGRLGKSKLKHKIRYRAQIILSRTGEGRFPELLSVINDAVDCRNHYVHGSEAKINYSASFFETAGFFTDTLEFVFGVSDLIECGWDFPGWISKGSSLSHPFSAYVFNYKESLSRFKRVGALKGA